MTEYQANSLSYLNFDITKGEEKIGNLSYRKWYPFDATFEIAGNHSFTVETKGKWNTIIEVKDDDDEYFKLDLNWNGDIVIQAMRKDFQPDRNESSQSHDAPKQAYLFKSKGFFQDKFIFIDQEGSELLTMKPVMKWKKLHYQYHIQTSEDFESLEQRELLLFIALISANYYMWTVVSSMG